MHPETPFLEQLTQLPLSGVFESHLTIEASDLVMRERFHRDCQRQGLKCVSLCQANAPVLHTLGLAHCDLGDVGVKFLAESALLQSVQHLGLGHNRFESAGAQALAATPAPNLVVLDLAENPLGDEGGVALASGKILATVRRLDLHAGRVDPPAGQHSQGTIIDP